MVFATVLLIFATPRLNDVTKVVNDSHAAVAVAAGAASKDSEFPASLPEAPTPKLNAEPEAIQPTSASTPFEPVKPAITRPQETHRLKMIWFGLAIAGHGGAAFDAWSTKRAVVGGYGQEANPLLRPFAHSNAIYAATQVSPAFMDFLGKRMMVSQHKWARKIWWLPQATGASFSFAAGAHNVGVVH